MKKIWIVLMIMELVLVSCSFGEDPVDMMKQSAKTMNRLHEYTVDNKTDISVGMLGVSMNYDTKGNIYIEKDGNSKKVVAKTVASFNGNSLAPQKVYMSKDKVATFDPNENRWAVENLNDGTQTENETKWIVNQILSLYNPESTLNQIANSLSTKTVKKIDEKEIDGVKCTGLSVEIQADDFIKNLSDFLGESSGVDGASAIFEQIGTSVLKNSEAVYWIGNNDHYIHESDLTVSIPLGKITSVSKLSGFNKKEAINIP